MALADLLEQMSSARMGKQPELAPPEINTMGPVPSRDVRPDAPANTLQSLLPLLAARGGNPGRGAQGTGGNSNWESVARQMAMRKYGYSPADFNALDSIIERESGWNPNAVNESSGAAGIAQRISGYDQSYSQNQPREQIRWLLNYINDRYGTPQAALDFKNRTGWY